MTRSGRQCKGLGENSIAPYVSIGRADRLWHSSAAPGPDAINSKFTLRLAR